MIHDRQTGLESSKYDYDQRPKAFDIELMYGIGLNLDQKVKRWIAKTAAPAKTLPSEADLKKATGLASILSQQFLRLRPGLLFCRH